MTNENSHKSMRPANETKQTHKITQGYIKGNIWYDFSQPKICQGRWGKNRINLFFADLLHNK